MDIFVGNLSFDATGGDVKKLFEGFGNVASVVIVMEKEKKAPKSRGFGFVQMPDEQQALAALAALNNKEFMGRVLNVNPAHPKGQKAMVWPPIAKAKTEAQAASKLKEKRQPKVTVEAKQYPREETEQKKSWFSPVFNKHPALKDGRVRPSGQHLALSDGKCAPFGQPGTYKGGRRTRSYVKRHGLTGIQEDVKPRRKNQGNPMRWRKKKDQPKPWQKSPAEHKPWKKAEEGARPWKKTGGEIRTWREPGPGEESKPWKKSVGESKPWRKSNKRPRPRQSRIESRRKPGGYKR